MKHLFVGAHPDDLEFGCAGTARQVILNGGEALFLVLTDGGRGGDPEARKIEQERACKLLGVEYRNLGWTDLGVFETEETVAAIKEIVREYAPDVIYTHARRDKHPDHINTTLIVEKAAEAKKTPLLYFRSFSSIAFDPCVTVRHCCAEEKEKALSCHKSQIDKYKNRGIDFIKIAMPQENEECFEM